MTPRLPDFLIIGAMRSGTTSLHEWLSAQPELWLVPSKEPHFFSKNVEWNKGIDAYKALFAAASPGQLVGESSTSYSDPKWHEQAAERLASTVPHAKLLFIARHPIERLISDVQHEIRQGRETRPAAEVLSDPASPSVQRSLYFHCLEPYFARFGTDQLLVVRFEDLVDSAAGGWDAVLAHLGLRARPAPGTAHNVGKDLPNAAPVMRWLRRQSWAARVRRIPKPVRVAGKRLISRVVGLRTPRGAPAPLAVGTEVSDAIWRDVLRLEDHLRRERPLWPR